MNELVKVPFDDGEILCVTNQAGEHVVIKPMCEQMGLDSQAQQRRLQRTAWGRTCTAIMAVQLPGDQQRREVFCLHRKRVAMWLATLDTRRVRPEVRPFLEALQERAADVLDAYFSGRTAQDTSPAAEALVMDLRARVERLEAAQGLPAVPRPRPDVLERVREALPDLRRPVVMADVLAALGLPNERGTQMIVGAALRALGLARRRTRTHHGLQYRVWN